MNWFGRSCECKPFRSVSLALALLSSSILGIGSASAQSQPPAYTDLHDFYGQVTFPNGTTGRDMGNPQAMVMDKSGNKFIIGIQGGSGLVEYTAGGQYIVLQNFPGGGNNLAIDANGNLFGTTTTSVWEFTNTGVYKDLYDFGQMVKTTNGVMAPDGIGGSFVTVDSSGNIFGVSQFGGVVQNFPWGSYGPGFVFEIPAGGTFKDIHDFGGTITLANGTSGTDGFQASRRLSIDSFGDVYGTTTTDSQGNSAGNLWEITTSGAYLDLHDFGGTVLDSNGNSQADGLGGSNVICDANDNLYGSCINGGGFPGTASYGAGTVWKLSATGAYSILHNFGLRLNNLVNDPFDGRNPSWPMVADTAGNVYGYVQGNGYLLYEITGGNYYDINDFGGTITSASGSPTKDGLSVSSLVLDPSGALFGTSFTGSLNNSGLLFKMNTASTLDQIVLNNTDSGLGQVGTGYVRISTPSTSDTVVSLSSDNSNLPVSSTIAGALPPTITIPAGQTEVAFSFTPISTFTNQTADVTASAGGVSVTGSVGLIGVQFTGFAVSYVGGGPTATGTLYLNEPAPTGGVPVNLTTTNSGIAPPATVTVPAGQTYTQFAISMIGSTSAKVSGTVTASYGGFSESHTLTINPVQLASLNVTPTEAEGTTVFTATASLTAGVSSDTTLTVATNSPFVMVPATAVVPAGSSSVTFNVGTSAVSATIPVLVKVTLGNTAKTQYITLDKTVVPTLTNLTISPGEAAGGTTFNATVTLSSIALTGGTPVTIATNSPFDSPPTTVTVPAGSTSLTFAVPTSVVSANVSVLLKATLGSTTKTLYFTLDKVVAPAPVLTNLTVSPSEGIGGSQFMATMTLSAAAPTGGTVVALATNSPFVSPTATVTVPAGQTSFTFPVSTSVVNKSVVVLLKASLGSSVKTFYFTLDP